MPDDDRVSASRCLEQVQRAHRSGDLTAAVAWSRRLTEALLVEGDDAVALEKLARRTPRAHEPSGRGVALDAAADQMHAAFDAVRGELADRPIVSTVAELGELLGRLPGEIALVVEDHVRVPRGVTLGEDAVLVVVAEMTQVHTAPATPVSDDRGQEYHVLEPALQLALQWLPDAAAPACAVEDTVAENLFVRAMAAAEDGRLAECLTSAAALLEQLAVALDTEIPEWLPGGRPTTQLSQAASTLRYVSAALGRHAPGLEELSRR
ncbi:MULTISPECIES: hypothetical protein [unclassified Amycolatopsis]|uniref:hypothetical protein n=1 Tax=unclassified Amycolatopsis TaxID=2618356 RepID=UPI00287552CC|nr:MULTISPECIES: hypothetical protein [unclassified Amycolatopsis]MDS0140610.1 hypothetical protein [Amycolatopsis sp. 505]MDS0149260.1 hypothetical protein [Amycolatopsis sp. CM201R]